MFTFSRSVVPLLAVLSLGAAAAAAAEPPPATEPAFDAAKEALRYEAFLYGWIAAITEADGADVDRLRYTFSLTAKKALTIPQVAPFPVSPQRGAVIARAGSAPKVVGTDGKVPSAKLPGAMADVDEYLMACDPGDTGPVLCVPGACYYRFQACEYFKYGFWLALDRIDGKDVVVGVLSYRKAPEEEPEKDKRYKAWRAALEKQRVKAAKPR